MSNLPTPEHDRQTYADLVERGIITEREADELRAQQHRAVRDDSAGWISGSSGRSDHLIRCAVHALRVFADDPTREDANELLSHWRYHRELSAAQVALILDAFEPVARLPEHDGYKITGRVR